MPELIVALTHISTCTRTVDDMACILMGRVDSTRGVHQQQCTGMWYATQRKQPSGMPTLRTEFLSAQKQFVTDLAPVARQEAKKLKG